MKISGEMYRTQQSELKAIRPKFLNPSLDFLLLSPQIGSVWISQRAQLSFCFVYIFGDIAGK